VLVAGAGRGVLVAGTIGAGVSVATARTGTGVAVGAGGGVLFGTTTTRTGVTVGGASDVGVGGGVVDVGVGGGVAVGTSVAVGGGVVGVAVGALAVKSAMFCRATAVSFLDLSCWATVALALAVASAYFKSAEVGTATPGLAMTKATAVWVAAIT